MTDYMDPIVTRRRLRVELRKARESAHQKQNDVARAMDWSPSKLIRIENGVVGISTNDLRVLLAHYGIKDKRRIDQLLELARASRERSWFDAYSDLLSPGFREFLAYESSAAVIRQFQPTLVPGLLQTEEYAQAVFREVFGQSEEWSERRWTVRRRRQELLERPDPPEVLTLLDEAVIRRHVGGPRVMRQQLEHLRQYINTTTSSVQIIPFSAGGHPGTRGPIVLLEFIQPDLDDMVFLEAQDNTALRDVPEETARFADQFEQLRKLALDVDQTAELVDGQIAHLTEAIQRMERGTEQTTQTPHT